MSTGKRVQVHRKKRGLTQEQLAKLLDVSRLTVLRVENGRTRIKPSCINRWAKALDVTPEYLRRGWWLT